MNESDFSEKSRQNSIAILLILKQQIIRIEIPQVWTKMKTHGDENKPKVREKVIKSI
jgi:hypothetical protein